MLAGNRNTSMFLKERAMRDVKLVVLKENGRWYDKKNFRM